jgi:orotate phosphoribosyltransferase
MNTGLIKAPTAAEAMQMNLAALRSLRPGHPRFFDRDLTRGELNHIFRMCDALWLHSGDPKAPHAELTGGKCSNGFVDTLRVLRYTNLCWIMAEQLVRLLRRHYHYSSPVDWVIGSDHAGAALSHAVATLLGVQHDFTEKGPDKTQVWKRFAIEPGEVVLQVEELVTTTGTLKAVREGVRAGNPSHVTFAPLCLTLVHRSDEYELEGAPIVHAAHYDIQTWRPEECPLCKGGSKRLRPKQNWAELTGKAP